MTNFKTILNNSKVRSFGKTHNSHLLTNLDSIVEQVLQNTYQYLSQFRFDAEYTQKLETAFGNDFDGEVANQLFNAFAEDDFSAVPTIEVVNSHDINGANGAFSITTGKIYLAAEFIHQNAENLDAVVAVLLEEIGHSVDARINTTDAAGDEGDIFARLVQEEIISASELAVLRAEDDTATVTLDGQVVEIEQQIFKVANTNDSGAGSLRQAIIDAGNAPGLDVIDLSGIATGVTNNDINGVNKYVISLQSSLPTLTGGNDVFFIGGNKVIISGEGKSQIISINGPTVGFDGITFRDGLARGGDGVGGGGGGLGAGGAIFINSGNVGISNSTFFRNKAQGCNSTGNAGQGGSAALIEWVHNGQKMLTHSTGENGTSGGAGGSFNVTGVLNLGSGGSGGSGGARGQ